MAKKTKDISVFEWVDEVWRQTVSLLSRCFLLIIRFTKNIPSNTLRPIFKNEIKHATELIGRGFLENRKVRWALSLYVSQVLGRKVPFFAAS